MRRKGLSNRVDVCLSVRGKKIETAEICGYSLQKCTITTFELFFEGHSTNSAIYYLWELQIQSFLISYCSSPIYSAPLVYKYMALNM